MCAYVPAITHLQCTALASAHEPIRATSVEQGKDFAYSAEWHDVCVCEQCTDLTVEAPPHSDPALLARLELSLADHRLVLVTGVQGVHVPPSRLWVAIRELHFSLFPLVRGHLPFRDISRISANPVYPRTPVPPCISQLELDHSTALLTRLSNDFPASDQQLDSVVKLVTIALRQAVPQCVRTEHAAMLAQLDQQTSCHAF